MSSANLKELLDGFQAKGMTVSELLNRNLQIGYDFAKARDYVPASDILLYGLFHSNNAVASITSELTPKPQQFAQILNSSIEGYRNSMFPPELTYHCSRGFPQYSVKKGYKEPSIRDNNWIVYDRMIKSANTRSSQRVETIDLLDALLQPQLVRQWAIVFGDGMRRPEQPSLASEILEAVS